MVGCTPSQTFQPILPTEIKPPATQTASPTQTPEITAPATQLPSPTPGTSPVHSPLAEFNFNQLEEIITTPFEAPLSGQDNGHHGIDFAFYSYGELQTMTGLPVLSMFDGKVAGIINNRPPYGNAIIIETPTNQLPSNYQEIIDLIPTPKLIQPDPRLYCPDLTNSQFNPQTYALYLLYAHLDQPVEIPIGTAVKSGDAIGAVGNTGYSGNAHLHLEMRLGPEEVQFPMMAHYINNASQEEMKNYCLWRVSSLFSLIDPTLLLQVEWN